MACIPLTLPTRCVRHGERFQHQGQVIRGDWHRASWFLGPCWGEHPLGGSHLRALGKRVRFLISTPNQWGFLESAHSDFNCKWPP